MKLIDKILNTVFLVVVYIFFLDIQMNKGKIFSDINYVLRIRNYYLFGIKKLRLNLSFKKYSKHLFIKYIKNKISMSEEYYAILKELWLNHFKKTNNDDTKMVLSKLFYLCDLFDNEISENIMEFAKNTSNAYYRYWTTMDISYMTFSSQKGVYNKFYCDRKKLFKQISQENYFKIPKKLSRENKNECLCVIVHQLDANLFHSVQRVAVMITNGLHSFFKKIEIICLDSFYLSKYETDQINTLFLHGSSSYSLEQIKSFYKENVEIYSPRGNYFYERYQDVLNRISEVNPNMILDMSDEFSPISYNYFQSYKTFYFPLRNYVSSSFFTYFLSDRDICKKVNKDNFNVIELASIKNWIFPEYIPSKSKFFTKNDLGFNNNNFIIISIGNNTFENDFIRKMSGILRSNSNLIWVLVGGKASAFTHCFCKEFFKNHQIIEWGFEDNLIGLCNACDVVLRPSYTGGSGGTAIAAQAGLPIVMTNYICDATRWLGLEYSKIESNQDLVNEIEKLYTDHNYYMERVKLTKEKIKIATDITSKYEELANILLRE